jgi:hypothetical protein
MANTYDTILNAVSNIITAIDPSLPTTITREFPVIREGDASGLPLIVVSPRTERLEVFSGESDEAFTGTYPVLVSLFTATPNQLNDTLTVNDYRKLIARELLKLKRSEYSNLILDPVGTIDEIEYDPRPAYDFRGNQAGINVSNQLFTFRTIEAEE